MSLDTHIRFLQPIDPRTVWAVMREVIEAPAEYMWDRYPPNPNIYEVFAPNPVWTCNGYAMHQAGIHDTSIVAATMYYGAEGSRLDDREYDEEFPPEQVPPPAYVHIHFCNGDRDRHDELAHRLITALGLPAAVEDNYHGTWTLMGLRPTLGDVQQALGFTVTA